MKGSQIIFAFVFALCVASQKDYGPRVDPLDSFGSNGQQQFYDGRPVTVPVELNIPPRYPPPPPPRQPQPINPFGKPVQQRGNEGYPTQKDIQLQDDQQLDQNDIPKITQGDDPNLFAKSGPPPSVLGDTFEPWDKGLPINTCIIVKYFAFRAGSNKDAPSKYLTASCQQKTLDFQKVIGGPLDTQLFTAYQMGNTWVFQSKSCPFYFIRVPPGFILKLTLGPHMSSKFIIQNAGISNYIRTNFYAGPSSTPLRSWSGYSIVQVKAPLSRYMVQYWP